MFRKLIVPLALAASVLLAACAAPSTATPPPPPTIAPTTATTAVPAPTTNLTDGCVNRYDPAIDYFPKRAALTHTEGFTLRPPG
jgi:uncharacterized lipoprotein YajG